jgi:hypothetical protein
LRKTLHSVQLRKVGSEFAPRNKNESTRGGYIEARVIGGWFIGLKRN